MHDCNKKYLSTMNDYDIMRSIKIAQFHPNVHEFPENNLIS